MVENSNRAVQKIKTGRPRQFNEAHVRSLLMELFWDKGYEGTSLSDIMEGTGLAKASLYGTFGDKRGMYHAALAAYQTGPFLQLRRALTDGETPARDRLKTFLTSPLSGSEAARRRGCFLCRAAADQAPHNSEAEKLVMGGMTQLHADLIQVLTEIGARDAEALATSYLSLYSGLRIMSSAGAPPSHLSAVLSMALKGL